MEMMIGKSHRLQWLVDHPLFCWRLSILFHLNADHTMATPNNGWLRDCENPQYIKGSITPDKNSPTGQIVNQMMTRKGT
jgi:hypothetical protein